MSKLVCKHNILFPKCDECNKGIKTFLKLTNDFGVNTANEWAESESE